MSNSFDERLSDLHVLGKSVSDGITEGIFIDVQSK